VAFGGGDGGLARGAPVCDFVVIDLAVIGLPLAEFRGFETRLAKDWGFVDTESSATNREREVELLDGEGDAPVRSAEYDAPLAAGDCLLDRQAGVDVVTERDAPRGVLVGAGGTDSTRSKRFFKSRTLGLPPRDPLDGPGVFLVSTGVEADRLLFGRDWPGFRGIRDGRGVATSLGERTAGRC
jgi:hypothetical protein